MPAALPRDLDLRAPTDGRAGDTSRRLRAVQQQCRCDERADLSRAHELERVGRLARAFGDDPDARPRAAVEGSLGMQRERDLAPWRRAASLALLSTAVLAASSGAAREAARAPGPRTLLSVPYGVGEFAQDGPRIAWSAAASRCRRPSPRPSRQQDGTSSSRPAERSARSTSRRAASAWARRPPRPPSDCRSRGRGSPGPRTSAGTRPRDHARVSSTTIVFWGAPHIAAMIAPPGACKSEAHRLSPGAGRHSRA